MIRYALRCSANHAFDSWFQSAEAFDKLNAAHMVACPECGDTEIAKAMMAPRIGGSRKEPAAQASPVAEPAAETTVSAALAGPSSPAEAALRELKKRIQENSEYVGPGFAREARKIHEGEAPERPIYGEATTDDARKLAEEGVPVVPLPFIPIRKAN